MRNIIEDIKNNNYLVECDTCGGTGVFTKIKYGKDTVTETKEPCKKCNGKGKLYIGGHAIKVKLMALNREISHLWDIIKHKQPIPQEYYYDEYLNPYHTKCNKCDGKGSWFEVVEETDEKIVKKPFKCNECNGSGTVTDYNTIYKNIFNDFVEGKEYKELLNKSIQDQQWNQYIEEYKEYKPSRELEVCARCTEYNDKCNSGSACDICKVDCNRNTRIFFRAVNEKADQWYKNIGHKFV